MDINIINFRGIETWKEHFHEGLTLLKGKSGDGKSTILEAVKWCLYGQTRHVFPFSGKKDTEVSVSLNGITITRKKNPELIKWCEKDLVLEDSAAEKQIESYFGSKLLWQAGSYIQQSEKIVLLAGSNNEKSALIKEIVFSGQEEKSEQLIYKFRNKITELEKDIHSYIYMMKDIENKIKEYNEDNQLSLNKAKDNFFDSKLYKNKDLLLSKLEDIKLNIQTNKEQENINKLLEEKNKFLEENKEKIKKYPANLNQKIFINWQKYIEYKKILQDLDEQKDIIIEEDIEKLLHLKSIQANNKIILSEFDLTEENIEQELIDLEKNIQIYHIYEKYKDKHRTYIEYQKNITKYQDYFDNLTKLEENIMKNWRYINVSLDTNLELNQTNIIVMEEKLKQFIEGFLNCPNCGEKLSLKDNKLIKKNIFIDEKTLDKLNNILANIKLYLKNKENCYEKLKVLKESEIEKPEEKPASVIDDIDYSNNKLIKLSQYKKIDDNDINNKIIILKNREKINKIKQNISEIYETIFDEYTIDEDNYFYNFISLKNNIKDCEEYITKHENKEIIDFQKEEKLMSRIEEKLDIIIEQENIHLIIEKLNKYKTRYQEQEEKFNQANNELKLCHKIIKIIQHSENESFTRFINYFNILTNEILAILFENCYVKIKPFKENDKNKTIKAQLDFNIFIDGNKYDNWHILSGGEKDRVSIAMTLAFNYLKANKILLLDECMASLDVDNRAKCLKAIKKYAKDKIVINICHETVEGFYDNIIDY